MKQKGFTLIELIVVMAIIAILVLIAAPKFMGYTERAKLTQVINNIKVSEKAAEQYYLQHDLWPRDQTATPYTVTQLNTWVDDFRNLSGETVTLEPGDYYEVDWDKLKGFMDKPDNNFKYIIQNPVGDIYYANDLTPAGEQTVFAGIENFIPKAVITMTPNSNVTSETNVVFDSLSSTDSDLGDIIVESEWQIDDGVISKIAPAKTFLPGTHNVKLRVKDSYGNWSNWESLSFQVEQALIDLIPKMTSNTSPSGIASGSNLQTNFYAWQAFAKGTSWCYVKNVPGILSYEFQTSKTVVKYSIIASTFGPAAAPKNWTFEGYNGSTWTILDTRNNISDWDSSEKFFTINNPALYKTYRIIFTATNGYQNSGYYIMSINNISMFGY